MSLLRLSNSIIKEIAGYTQILGNGSSKPSRKFISSATLGLAMAGSILLSDVARKLKGLSSITFHAGHKKLCRGLKSAGWSALNIQNNYLRTANRLIPANATIACDLGDISKTRSRKMPGIRSVRDGSTGAIKKGWWLIEIEAVFGRNNRHLPLWLELFSVSRGAYKSQRALVETAISFIVGHIGRKCLWLFDRGFDSWEYFKFFGQAGLNFIVRSGSCRIVICLKDGKRRSISSLVRDMKQSGIFVWGRKRTKTGYVIRVSYERIEIPQSGQKLFLVAAKGFGRNPLILLTSQNIDDGAEAVKAAKAYLKRWGVEEAGRLIKQAFRLENIRVLSWAGLVKLVWLAMWTYGFLCMMKLKMRKACKEMTALYPSFGKEPAFGYYRLAAGFASLMTLIFFTRPVVLRGAL